jgi:hypothetical protein
MSSSIQEKKIKLSTTWMIDHIEIRRIYAYNFKPKELKLKGKFNVTR